MGLTKEQLEAMSPKELAAYSEAQKKSTTASVNPSAGENKKGEQIKSRRRKAEEIDTTGADSEGEFG